MNEINSIRSDKLEIDCQKIYDSIIACERVFDNNELFKSNILEILEEVLELLYTVNDVELFGEMITLIFRFKVCSRALEDAVKFIDDEKIKNSSDLNFILEEMAKFKEII